MADPLYLGFDLSTQQLKGIAVDSELTLVYEAKVEFDADLPRHGVVKGVLTNPAEGEVFAPVAMWLEALDLVLERLREQGLDFARVRGISGAGMQHGTVFWSGDAEGLMQSLDPQSPLPSQLKSAFVHEYSPNWQDASTQKQCEEFDACLGGPKVLADVTGSKAHHRFSGPQILRFRIKYPDRYDKAARISLVSSFLASILVGRIVPIDLADVCGMALWDIRQGCWDDRLLELVAGCRDGIPQLKEKLHMPVNGGVSLGLISAYFTTRYGFSPTCRIIPFTGDNPATMLALPLRESDAIVSLGTSTTFLMSTPHYRPDPAYHFMNHPTTAGQYMFMLCYKNGGLARENVRDALNGAKRGGWEEFEHAASSTIPLGQGVTDHNMRLGLFFPQPEIVPNVKAGTWRYLYNDSTFELDEAADGDARWPLPESDARAILESQFLSLRLRSQSLVSPQADPQHDLVSPSTGSDPGAQLPPQPRRIYLVGGGSQSAAIARICGEVLGSAEGIFRLDIGGNACALGAAYKALWARERSDESFDDLIGKKWREQGFVQRIADGFSRQTWEKYGRALIGFDMLERRLLAAHGEAGQEMER